MLPYQAVFFFFSSRRRHTRYWRGSSDVCSSDLEQEPEGREAEAPARQLHEEDLAHVAPAVLQDREALAHPRPEGLGAQREPRDQRQQPDRQEGDRKSVG